MLTNLDLDLVLESLRRRRWAAKLTNSNGLPLAERLRLAASFEAKFPVATKTAATAKEIKVFGKQEPAAAGCK